LKLTHPPIHQKILFAHFCQEIFLSFFCLSLCVYVRARHTPSTLHPITHSLWVVYTLLYCRYMATTPSGHSSRLFMSSDCLQSYFVFCLISPPAKPNFHRDYCFEMPFRVRALSLSLSLSLSIYLSVCASLFSPSLFPLLQFFFCVL
jgi:hypothetical protein